VTVPLAGSRSLTEYTELATTFVKSSAKEVEYPTVYVSGLRISQVRSSRSFPKLQVYETAPWGVVSLTLRISPYAILSDANPNAQ
jgi:hypothetical protein